MTRDTSIFSPDLVIDVSGEEAPIDTSHIYTGEIFGKLCEVKKVIFPLFFFPSYSLKVSFIEMGFDLVFCFR